MLRHCYRLLALLVLVFCPIVAQARDLTSLQGEFWLDYQPMGQDGPKPAPTKDEALKALLEEARVCFSAMIYGYDFTYRPGDTTRQAEEGFTLTPSGQISWGDADMEFREMRSDAASLYLRVRYLTKPDEIARLEAWSSNHLMDSSAAGRSSYFLGTSGKLKAFEASCREAVRAYARSLTHNKPDMIEGHFILSELPRFGVIAGEYQAITRIKLRIDTLDAYRNY